MFNDTFLMFLTQHADVCISSKHTFNGTFFMFQVASGVQTVLKTVHAKMEVAVNLIPENVFVLQDGKAFTAHINVVTNFSA